MNNLWAQLQQAKLVSGQIPIDSTKQQPWYLRAVKGFAGWVASFFMLGFFAIIFGNLSIKLTSVQLLVFGFSVSVVAYIFFKNKKNDFLDQFALSFSLSGQALFAFGLFDSIFSITASKMFVLGCYQLLLAIILPNYIHRLLTTLVALLVILTATFEVGLSTVVTGVLAFFVSIIWLYDNKWGKYWKVVEPIAYALVIGLVYIQAYVLNNLYYSHASKHISNPWLLENSLFLSSVFISLAFVHLAWVTLNEYKVKLLGKEGILSIIFCVMVAVLSFKISGLSTGLLIALLGFIRKNKTLMTIGVCSVIGFFSWYYTNLDLTLLVKSLLLMGVGFSLIVAYLIFGLVYYKQRDSALKSTLSSKFNHAKWISLITVAFVLLAININISKKETLIQNGEQLLFRLGPVDPRSIMQGDYMRLRFDMATKIAADLRKINSKNTLIKQKGLAIVKRGVNNVVEYVELYNKQNLKASHYAIPYKSDGNRITIITDAYYFQEGKRSYYQAARFGEFRYYDTEMLLVKLIDADFNVL